MSQAESAILQPGHNCWQQLRAREFGVMVDGEAYFSAVREAILQARHSVFILGWDIDTRLRLVRGEDKPDGPHKLGEVLHAALKRNRRLDVYILIWDWAVLYLAERQWVPLYNYRWRRHRRLHFELDDYCPFGASQHQKIVVIDDELAFIGGFDLSKDRWDTCEHLPDDPRRINTDGEAYPPFHDIQAAVSGAPARALAEHARERWQMVTGRTPKAMSEGRARPWPKGVEVLARDLDVALSRTAPEYQAQKENREIESLLIDAIDNARDTIYIENEYLTSNTVGKALLRAMEKTDGPEIVLVLPKMTGNWLEQNTMDVLRWRLLRRLRETQARERLYVCYPEREGLGDAYISLHAKLLIVDDRLLTLGSANLSNRSMGFDTECNLVIEARDDDTRTLIRRIWHGLLGEHLNATAEEIGVAFDKGRTLIELIEDLRGRVRSLEPLDGRVPEFAESILPDRHLVDPESPVNAERMADLMLPHEESKSTLRQLTPVLITLAILAILAAAWRWTPMSEWLDTERLQAWMDQASESPLALVAVPVGFMIAGLLSIPLTLLVIVTALVFGPWIGFLYSMGGSVLSAVTNFVLGKWLAGDLVRRIAGKKLNRLSERLAERGIIAVATLRLVPIAPYGVVNLVAGASHLKLRDFIIGSIIGLTPGLLAVAVFSDQVATAIREPSVASIATLVAAAAGLALLAWGMHRWVEKRDRKRAAEKPAEHD